MRERYVWVHWEYWVVAHMQNGIGRWLKRAIGYTTSLLLPKSALVYDTYPQMLLHFLNEDGRYGKLMLKGEGLRRFRYDNSMPVDALTLLPFEKCRSRLKEVMPTKPVCVPLSRFA